MPRLLPSRRMIVVCFALTALTLIAASLPAKDKDEKRSPAESSAAQVDAAAVQRARETVQMLDEVYKTIVVLVTDKYVHDEDDFAAGSAAVELFRQVSKGDAQKVRLIDATGDPYEPKNVAKTDFEKAGIKRLKDGAASHDEVFTADGKPYLRVVTAVPVVHKKCVMCHSHYADAKDGEPIGALSYIVPVK